MPTVPVAATTTAPNGGAPSTDFLNYSEPLEVKSTIGIRKIQPKRGVKDGILSFLFNQYLIL